MRNVLASRLILPTLTLTLCVIGSTALAATWTGLGATDNWNDVNNWSDSADPTGKEITFDGTAGSFVGTAGTVNNIVTSTISVGSLIYQANSFNNEFHTTQINSGVVLNITGGLFGFTTGADNNTHYTITGDGELNYNSPGGTFQFGRWSGGCCNGNRHDTLDMSGLATFTMNANTFLVGQTGAASPLSTMTLANTNNITANTMTMSRANDQSELRLGENNTLHIGTINMVNNNHRTAAIRMRTGLSDPSVIIRDQSGSGGADLNMGINPNNTSPVTATMDLRGADVDAQFNDVLMGVGRATAGGDTGTGIISFDEGTMSMASLEMAFARRGGGSGRIDVEGTAQLTIDTAVMANVTREGSANARFFVTDSGQLEIQTLTMGNYTTGTITPVGSTNAEINLQGGTFRGTTVLAGDDSPTANTRVFNFASGTIANRTGTNLSIAPEIDIVLDTTGSHNVTASAGQSITVGGVISEVAPGASGLTFDGAGTVLLNGVNTFTGDSTVPSGFVGGTGSLAGHVDVTGGRLSPGASAGTFSIDSGSIASPGGLAIELGGTTVDTEYDQLLVNNDLALGGTLEITFIDGFFPDIDDVFTVVDAGSITGKFDNVLVTNGAGYFDVVYNYGAGQVLLTNYQIPEPASFWLLLGVGAIAFRRRRSTMPRNS